MTWTADEQRRSEARVIASQALEAEGFELKGIDWRGELCGQPCRVELPEDFPFCLPKVWLATPPDSMTAHVDRSGKVCVAAENGILLDVENPQGLVRDTLQRARAILGDSYASVDIAREYDAYWLGTTEVWSLCTRWHEARQVSIATTKDAVVKILAADSEDDLRRWCDHRRVAAYTVGTVGYIIPLHSPPFDLIGRKRLRVRDLLRLLPRHLRAADKGLVHRWLRQGRLPAFVFFAFPVGDESEDGVICLQLRPPPGLSGFRPGRMTLQQQLWATLRQDVAKLRVVRIDQEYLLPRGGVSRSLRDSAGILVGAGAVGGWVAQLLSFAGISDLAIVDHDQLNADNAHRHVLGMRFMGTNKASAMAHHLGEMLPGQSAWGVPLDAITAFTNSKIDPTAADFVVLATGDETLELRLSASLRTRVQLVHIWLDPIDLGFHILIDGKEAPGCFQCLFALDDEVGLYNRASFFQRGQVVTKSMAGCLGTFAPYSVEHALSAAMELVRRLQGTVRGPLLVSHRSSTLDAEQRGFVMSRRYKLFAAGESRQESGFVDPNCQGCSGR